MILSDPRGRPTLARIGGRATLDDLLHRAAERRPEATALLDPPNRDAFTDGTPRSLTYAQADRMVSAIAGRLRGIGLFTDAVVGIQIANTVESVLTMLAVLRAGLIAMPLPLLWRRAETVAALSRVGAHALIVSGRVGGVDHYDLAMQIAAEVFPVRYVCGYGGKAPDGLIAFDDLFVGGRLDPLPPPDDERVADPGPGAHAALITWETTPDGPVPVARSHSELIAAGLAIVLESGLQQNAALLSTMTMSSLATFAVTVVPWLLLGGTLALHQPFDAAVLLAQIEARPFDAVVLPGSLVASLVESGHIAHRDRLANVIAIWRAPERLTRAQPWREPKARLIDVQVFGETGLIAAARSAGGRPAAIPFGVVRAPLGTKGGIVATEIAMTSHGTVALRGPMVPRVPFPPGAQRSGQPHLKVAANGFVDTGYACRPDSSTVVVTGPPPGLVSVGGYRFVVRELQELVGSVETAAGTLAVLPDALAGHRLAGTAADCDAIQASLIRLGTNPLLVGAFRPRTSEDGLRRA
jgi:hypothetical protein